MAKRVHHVVQHRSGMTGVEAMTMLTEHAFPRHSHDQFGIGVMTSGAQRSWSVLGQVESEAGDVIMVNPGEMHDGAPVGGVRGWHILYLDPALVAREIAGERSGEFVLRPVARDQALAARVLQLFKQLQSPTADIMLAEENLLCCLMRAAQKHGIDGPLDGGPLNEPLNGTMSARCSPSVSKAIQRLDDAPELSVSLSELAALSGVSRFQLLRGFFREIGTTPHAYLVQLRVRLARRYLAAGKSLTDAALLAGFADQSHMTRAFVRQFGVTPGRYKAAIA